MTTTWNGERDHGHGMVLQGGRDSQVSEGGDAAQRVGDAAGEAVVGEVQRLQPRQRAQLRRQTPRDVVVLQQPGIEKAKWAEPPRQIQ